MVPKMVPQMVPFEISFVNKGFHFLELTYLSNLIVRRIIKQNDSNYRFQAQTFKTRGSLSDSRDRFSRFNCPIVDPG